MQVYELLKCKCKKIIRRDYQKNEYKKSVRHDVIFLEIDNKSELEIYWKELKIGRDATLILYVSGKQVARFDCFRKDAGHANFYIHTPGKKCESRLYLPERTVE